MEAEGGILDDEMSSGGDPVITISPGGPDGSGDSPDLGAGPQPTSWSMHAARYAPSRSILPPNRQAHRSPAT